MIASSNFLIPNATLIVEIVAFLVVLAVVGRYVLPVLNKALEERQEQIRGALDAADAARAEADETRQQRQAILDEARHQARDIVSQANAVAERVRSEAQGRGQQEYDRLVASADAEIALARQRALEEASSKLGTLVMEVVERIIGREMDAAAHRDLIDEAVEALARDTGVADAAAAAAGSGSSQ